MAITRLELSHIGRYRVLEELGRGAMGVVHKADDPTLGRQVAVKAVLLSSDAAESAEYQARFYQEAKAAGGLNHPGIITIYDTGREGNWAYIAMELLEGVELRDLMAAGRMPLPLVLSLAAQVASALEFAHEQGVVHRDIKPGNIMVLRGDHAKIMDFGIARMRVSEVKTQVGLVLGSPKYMSPEQVAGRRVDHRSDVFSLGVVLFEMVAGMPPFSGNDIGDLMYTIVNTSPPRASQLNPAVPEFLDLIIAKALQKDVNARYQSAGELAADLVACQEALDDAPAPPREIGETTIPLDVAATVPRHAGVAKSATHRSRLPTERFRVADANENAPGNDATTVPWHADPAFNPPATLLLLSRRFDSAKALVRLAQPSVEDVTNLTTSSASNSRLAPRFRYTRSWGVVIMIITAIVGALVIALY
ncbi:MAG: serine/threonine protein kinase [Betaproteobacteria bacterium]|nr:serine/threonine protein kinase [Betaproteobacteria bacterium]